MKFTPTIHAMKQYSIRTATQPYEAGAKLLGALANATVITEAQAVRRFPITKIKKGDTYYLWYEERIKEDVLAIVRKDGAIVTVLTANVYDSLITKNPLARYMPGGKRLDTWYTKKGGVGR